MHLHVKMESHGVGKVFIDGEQVQGVTGVTLKIRTKEPNEACLTFLPNEITYEGLTDITSIGDSAVKMEKATG